MGIAEKIENKLLKVFPRSWIVFAIILLVALETIANIEGVRDFIKDTDMEWIYTFFDVFSQWFYPLLTIYLILVVGALRKLILPLNKMVFDLRATTNREITRLDNNIDGSIRNLTNYTNTEVKRIDSFREPLVIAHRHHIAEVSYIKAILLIQTIELKPNANPLSIRDYRVKAVSHIINSIIVSTALPLQLLELKMYLEVANQILLSVDKTHLSEAKSIYKIDIPDVLLNLQKLDTGGALSIEIGSINTTLHNMP